MVLLSNIFSNRFDDLLNISDKKDVISRHQTRNSTRFQLLNTRRNKVAGHSKIEKETLEKNKVTS